MLNGEKRRKTAQINHLVSNKNTTLHMQYTFLYISLPLFCTTTTRYSVTHFMEKNVLLLVFLFAIFSLPLIFNLLAAAC